MISNEIVCQFPFTKAWLDYANSANPSWLLSVLRQRIFMKKQREGSDLVLWD